MANETHAALVAEMRNRSRLAGYILPIMLARYADRLEAAHRREVEATAAKCCQLGRLAGYGASEIKHQQESVGDAAKLREVVKKVLDAVEHLSRTHNDDLPEDVRAILGGIAFDANTALAAPARNCDVGRDTLSAALEQVNKVYDILSRPCVCLEEARQGCREARGVLIPALAEPRLNCDVGTVAEQAKRFAKFCDSNTDGVVCNDDCPLRKNTSGSSCELAWAQMPYEEGVPNAEEKEKSC